MSTLPEGSPCWNLPAMDWMAGAAVSRMQSSAPPPARPRPAPLLVPVGAGKLRVPCPWNSPVSGSRLPWYSCFTPGHGAYLENIYSYM